MITDATGKLLTRIEQLCGLPLGCTTPAHLAEMLTHIVDIAEHRAPGTADWAVAIETVLHVGGVPLLLQGEDTSDLNVLLAVIRQQNVHRPRK